MSNAQELNAENTDVEMTDAEATDPDETEVEATDAEATDADETEVEATDAEATEAEATEAEATDAEATDAEATDAEDGGRGSRRPSSEGPSLEWIQNHLNADFPPLPMMDANLYYRLNALHPSSHQHTVLWKRLCNNMPAVTLRHCFSDERQPFLTEQPLPDGSNLTYHHRFHAAWKFYHDWLTWLYYKSIIPLDELTKRFLKESRDGYWRIDEDTARIDELKNLHREARKLVFENFRAVPWNCGHLNSRFKQRPEMNWVYDFRNSLAKIYANMDKEFEIAEQTGQSPATGVANAFNVIPLKWYMLLDSLFTEEYFEGQLRAFHVEDVSMNKRIHLLSDKHASLMLPQEVHRIYKKWGTDVLDRLRRIQHEMRMSYELRWVRDWGYGRAFKKLYHPVDCTRHPAWRTELNEALRLMKNGGHVGSNLWASYPMDLQGRDKEALTACAICMEEWKEGFPMLRTHCDHEFHIACAFQYWDALAEDRYTWRCPLCRQSPADLRNRVAFPQEMREDDYPEQARLDLMQVRSDRAAAHWNQHRSGLDQNITMEMWYCLSFTMRHAWWTAKMRESARKRECFVFEDLDALQAFDESVAAGETDPNPVQVDEEPYFELNISDYV